MSYLQVFPLILIMGLVSCRQTTTTVSETRGEPSHQGDTVGSSPPVGAPVVSGAPRASATAPPTPSAEQTSPGGNDAIAERLQVAGLETKAAAQFLSALKGLAAKGDRAGVCALASYPLAVNSVKAHELVLNQAQCQSGYDQIFTPSVIGALDKQQFADLQATSTGVMIGDGAVWFAGICADTQCQHSAIKVSAINN
jgi:hypothetical protein